jgi:YbgC/YbaW family acyl-CoA thioester hydrolase
MIPFQTTRRVEFGETDMAGIVHFSNYFRYMEAAESEFLRSRGLSVSWNEGDRHFGFPRVSVSCDYQRPARFEDLLDIAVTLEHIGRSSIRYRHDFSLRGQPLAVGKVTAVFCQSVQHGPMTALEIPDSIRQRLEE